MVKGSGRIKGSLHSYDVKDNEFYSGVYEVEEFLKSTVPQEQDRRDTVDEIMRRGT